ncbi:hypothetical protein [Roseivirga sp. 4D4]|uniref:hypothetical protein n=1 Tax=Roseivirga sp. 4D4 TaxID=1889784 RepID=UPI001112E0EF|nr:hypothetical protein [Roseivirga sp. 4D4]
MFTQPTLYLGTMNGQHKITLSGVVFYVEEECRKLLTDHLNIINRSNSAVKSEEMVDEKMAEMLLDELKEEGKEVITQSAVKHFIERTRYLR